MDDRRFHIICTGKGRHGQIRWSDLILRDDGSVEQAPARQAPLKDDAGRPVLRKAIVPTEIHRSATGTWRWRCPKCGIDKQLPETRLLQWMRDTRVGTLDLSLTPR